MRNLNIMCEGRTECNFIKSVLAEHLIQFEWIVTPITLPTGKNAGGVSKGGWRHSDGYKNALKQIYNTIVTNKFDTTYSTFFDLYGFPSDIPCYSQAKILGSPYEKVKVYETQIKQDVNVMFHQNQNYDESRFIPYIQPYEFESFLFVNTGISALMLLEDQKEGMKELDENLKQITLQFETPEHINSSPQTAPSKRIELLVPGFRKNKAGKHGFSWRIAKETGISEIRRLCHHFNEWLTYFETH